MILSSICIATYKRPELLKKLIESLLIQKNINLNEVEIIVVDNDPGGSAQKVIEDYFEKVNCKIYYFIQPEKNISLTRNMALDKIKGEYVFFIDDDEYADENWMSTHFNNLIKYDADGAFGQVRSYFSENTPDWIKNCMVYQRNTNPSGAEPANMNTGNCLIKSEFFTKKGYRFDKEYGITGGSDYQLFSKMVKDGIKLISCFEAVTYEYVSDSRANVRWLVRRVARTGNNFSRTQIEHAEGTKKLIVRVREFGKGSVQSVIALLISVLMIWNPTKSLNWFLTSVSNIMKPLAALGIYYQEYKVS
jgi:succinoglycan biosynthesis protein ExoM